ncbi:MAG: hypothetical protein DWQ04_20300 [Chloroflexi bacterium]|nr:MAG: hypothetical protein DWQ04_20300 [Chloroflexota bacterium]
MLQAELLDQLNALEKPIAYFQTPPQGKRSFIWQNGRIPLLISAPHATAHSRRGKIKGEEEYTAALAQLLAQETGAHALFTAYRSSGDPNWDVVTPYKSQLRKLIGQHHIRFVIDLHGMSNRHKFGIAVGTINSRSCPNRESIIAHTFESHKFTRLSQKKVQSYDKLQWHGFVMNHSRFTGGLVNHTITRFVSQSLGIAAVQIELCASIRIVHRDKQFLPAFTGNPQGITQAYLALASLVQKIAVTL